MSVDLSILVGNAVSLATMGYTRIEIWLSTDEGSSYEEITASAAAAATMTSEEASTTFDMGGKLLTLKEDGGAEQEIEFSDDLRYWTPDQVADRINEVVPGLASVEDDTVVLTSGTTGRTSSLEITYNDATDLGWEAGDLVYGKAARITLAGGTLLYTFQDPAGSSDYRYKWRFTANGSNPISDFSNPVYGSSPASLSSGSLSICTATFVDMEGKPVQRKVIVGQVSTPSTVSGYAVASEETKTFESDVHGYLQFALVRGIRVRVAIEGTNYVREFTVPSAATFDLFTVMAAADDTFTVQSTPSYASRRSL